MEPREIAKIFKEMRTESNIVVREIKPYSWGSKDECRELFRQVFPQIDETITHFDYLPEYEEVVDWMSDTKGKGLLLTGTCGRGKTIILSGLVPFLFRIKGLTLRPFHAQHMNDLFCRVYPKVPCNYPNYTCLDYLQYTGYPIIDELGTEPMHNDFGERYEGFNLVINEAERYNKPMFIATNLIEEDLLARYGERTIDRLSRLCRTVRFDGFSLRK